MKKLIHVILLMVLICALAGCTRVQTGNKMPMEDQFIVIEKTTNGGLFDNTTEYVYDRDTKIVYLYTFEGYHATMCPYYVIVDGVPQVAIYGETYR